MSQDVVEAVVADALTYVEIICGLLFYFFAVVVEALAEAAVEFILATIVVVPACLAVTTPLLLTVATRLFLENHVTPVGAPSKYKSYVSYCSKCDASTPDYEYQGEYNRNYYGEWRE